MRGRGISAGPAAAGSEAGLAANLRQCHGLGLLGVEDAVMGWEAEQDASSQDFRSPAVTAVTQSETCPSD